MKKVGKDAMNSRIFTTFVVGKKNEHYGREGFQTIVGQRVQSGAYRHAEPKEGVDGLGG